MTPAGPAVKAILTVAGMTTAAGLGTMLGLTLGEGAYRAVKWVFTSKPKAQSQAKKRKKRAKVLTLRTSTKSA